MAECRDLESGCPGCPRGLSTDLPLVPCSASGYHDGIGQNYRNQAAKEIVATRNWIREYQVAMQKDAEAGMLHLTPEGEQRNHPRLPTPGIALWVGVDSGLHLISLAPDRVELYSRSRLKPGQRLTVRLDDEATLELKVRRCRMKEADSSTLEVLFHVVADVLGEPDLPGPDTAPAGP